MTERDHPEARPNADPADTEIRQSRSGPLSEDTEARRPADQAIINQEQALESGEENVV